MKFIKIVLVLFLPLLVSGCLEELDIISPKKLLESGEITGVSFGERHLLTVETSKENLVKSHKDFEENCSKLGCNIVYSYLIENQKAYLKVLIANTKIDELISNANANVSKKSIIKGVVSTTADIQKRLEIKETAFKNLISSPNISNPIVVEKELERLQSEIETLKMISKVKDKPLEISKEKDDTAPAKNPSLVLLDVNFETTKSLGGFNISLIENALAKSYQIFATSTSYVIVFMALTLPWIPVAIIVMWLLAIIFKHKIKIRTITQMPTTTKNKTSFGSDPIISVEPKEVKKGFFGGLFAKKDSDDTEEEDI